MSGKRDSAPTPLAEWSTPTGGIWRSQPIHKLPPTVLYDSNNIVVRSGHITPRSGLVLTDPPIATGGYVNGGIVFTNVNNASGALFATTTHIGLIGPTSATDITGPVNINAQYLHTSTGSNNDLLFEARAKGVVGEAISIALVDPGSETAEETVDVTGTDIVVTLRNVSGVLSTASQVVAAIEANVDANELIVVGIEGTGAGIVEPLAATNLTNGVAVELTGDKHNFNRFTVIVFGTPDKPHVFHTNGVDTPRQWDGLTDTFVECECDPPKFSDVTTAFDRIIGIIPPYKVQWGEQLSLSQWPPLNARNLADTPDKVVAIRNLGTMNVIVYKEDTIWSGMARGGSSAQAFSFELRFIGDGPANPAALAVADNVHYYMARNGRIGAYDGRTHQWIGDGVWPLLQATLDLTKVNLITAWYDKFHHEITFNYPKVGETDPMTGLVILTLPRPQHGINTFGGFMGTWARPVSYGFDIAPFSNNPIVFTSAPDFQGVNILVPNVNDAGVEFSGHWQSGLVATPESTIMRPELETFVIRGAELGNLTARIRHAYILDTEAGTQSAAQTIALANVEPVEKKAFSAVRGRFFGYEYSFTTPIALRWKGALLWGRGVEQ